MTFSSSVKEELCKVSLSRLCCARAQAYGVLLYANTFTAHEIKIMTASADFAALLPRLFKKAFSLEFDSLPDASRAGKYILSISSREKIRLIFNCFGYDADSTLSHHINLGVLEEDCCKSSFVRGAFLAGGSITDPAKRYHLEIITDHMHVSRELYAMLLEIEFSPKQTMRGSNYVTYFKQSEAIEDFLTTIGAPNSAMAHMEAKVEKDMRNEINRKVNCDTANADRIVLAAQTQLEAIRNLDRLCGLDKLPEDLQQVAFLRIANPEASLADLSALSYPPISKSSVNNRLKKLLKFKPE